MNKNYCIYLYKYTASVDLYRSDYTEIGKITNYMIYDVIEIIIYE